MFARALTDLDRSQEVEPVSIDCSGRETWQHGNSLVNYMKMVCPKTCNSRLCGSICRWEKPSKIRKGSHRNGILFILNAVGTSEKGFPNEKEK